MFGISETELVEGKKESREKVKKEDGSLREMVYIIIILQMGTTIKFKKLCKNCSCFTVFKNKILRTNSQTSYFILSF